MTIRKITAGDGYLYLIRQVAHGDTDQPANPADNDTSTVKGQDAASYYTAEGNPPGRWTGRGAPLLGLENKQVTEEQMRALFGYGQHPDAEAIIASYLTQHVHADMTPRQLAKVQDDAIKAARLGRPFPEYAPLDRFDTRVERRLSVIKQETGRDPTDAEVKKVKAEEARRQRAAVAGFDLVFSPVKSAALLWAIDDRPHVRHAIRHAHEQAMHHALALLEQHAAYTRTGTGGIAQIETNGLTAAAFEHWDSRAGDPNLHTHVAVSTKVQGADGKWRSLDARALYQMTVAASECYNTAFETALTNQLGVSFTPRPDTVGRKEPVREISHIPFGMIEHFSRRRAQLEARYTQLARDYRRQHGRDPDAAACHKLAQQATLDTRPGKKPPRSLDERRAQWRHELTQTFGPAAVKQLMAAVPGSPGPAVPAAPDLQSLAERTVANVSGYRSIWTVWNLRAETERLLRTGCRFASLDEHRQAAEAVVNLAISPALSICVEAPALLDEPPALRRRDGESVFTAHGAARYTSQAVLDAEQRLITATRTPATAGVPALTAAASLDGFEAVTGTRLDAGQRHLVTAFASEDRLLLAGIGPAGAGKTTAMRAMAHVLRQHHRRLIPLATSATSADVLGRELSTPAENLHKFLYEWDRGVFAARLRSGGPVPDGARFYALRPGDVVLVDEAGMAGTFLLDRLVTIAASRGAVVRLLGDDRQLSAVESGGALRLIASQPSTPHLTMLYRFRDPAEAAATQRLRVGDTTAIDWYIQHGRVRSGSRDAMTQAAYTGWKTDMLAGKTTLMAAGDGTDVTALSAQARAERVTAGQVEPGGVALRDGNLAGTGDWIVTRDNQRRLSMHRGRDWVKNGDGWHVTTRHHDGSLTCLHLGHGGRVRLPADYVRAHVELLYATTAHRAEGVTVDTAHPLITGGMTREILYVLASRAREQTTLYVATHDLLPADEDERTDRARTDPRSYAAREILHTILATEGTELSATQTIHANQEQAGSLATLLPRYQHAAHQFAGARYRDAAILVFGDHDGRALAADPAWGALVGRLYDAETSGWQPARLLAAVARQRELGTADSIAEVLCWRIDAHLPSRTPPPPLDQPTTGDARRYAALLTTIGMPVPSPDQALTPPKALTPTASEHNEQVPAPARHDTTVTTVLGPRLAAKAQTEPAWPALSAALHRAGTAGYDPVAILSAAARSRELRTARSISEVLAWRIGHHLTVRPDPLPDSAITSRTPDPETWRLLAWTLKAAENNGTPAETIITSTRRAQTLGDLLTTAQANARNRPTPITGTACLPPWLAGPSGQAAPDGTVRGNDLARYLDDAANLITARVRALASNAERDQPAWATLLGQPPPDSTQREQWRHHVAIIAAYRDQYQITTDDPRQVLGPYPEPGHAGHTAYWHAVDSVVAARRVAGLEPAIATQQPDLVRAQIAADIYLILPDAERSAIATTMSARLGPLWFGNHSHADDHAATQPAYASHLSAVLTEKGHLPVPAHQRRCPSETPLEANLVQRKSARQVPSPPRRQPEPPPPGPAPRTHSFPVERSGPGYKPDQAHASVRPR
jgi:conjugative relaxase-like TrwC/TraI family protein